MSTHSDNYYLLKHQITETKSKPVNIITPAPIDHDTAIKIFRKTLHELVNNEYLSTGITEDEAELLHALIDGEVIND